MKIKEIHKKITFLFYLKIKKIVNQNSVKWSAKSKFWCFVLENVSRIWEKPLGNIRKNKGNIRKNKGNIRKYKEI